MIRITLCLLALITLPALIHTFTFRSAVKPAGYCKLRVVPFLSDGSLTINCASKENESQSAADNMKGKELRDNPVSAAKKKGMFSGTIPTPSVLNLCFL